MSTAGIYGAIIVNAPTTVTTASFTTSTSAVSLGTPRPRSVMFYVDVLSYIRFGASDVGAATSSYLPLAAGTPYVFNLTSATTHFRIIASTGTANYWFAPVA